MVNFAQLGPLAVVVYVPFLCVPSNATDFNSVDFFIFVFVCVRVTWLIKAMSYRLFSRRVKSSPGWNQIKRGIDGDVSKRLGKDCARGHRDNIR